MVLISVDVSEEMREKKKTLYMSWKGVLLEGFRAAERAQKIKELENKLYEIEKEFNKLNADHTSRGRKLAAYIDKYGVDENIIYGSLEVKNGN